VKKEVIPVNITPLDIQQQKFRVHWVGRGFDMVEVDNYLNLLAGEFEETLKENDQLRRELESQNARVMELEAEEQKIKEGLVTINQIVDEIKNNARKEGELIIAEAQENGRRIIDHAHAQALQIESEIQYLRNQREQFKASLMATVDMFRNLLSSPEPSPEPPLEAEKVVTKDE
jgi:cell division initiation protein